MSTASIMRAADNKIAKQNQQVHLQNVGKVNATPAKDITPGTKIMFNFGIVYTVESVTIGKMVVMSVIAPDGKKYTERKRPTTLMATPYGIAATTPAPTEETDMITQTTPSITNAAEYKEAHGSIPGGSIIRTADNRLMVVERSNGYVISGMEQGKTGIVANMVIDLRNTSATIVTVTTFVDDTPAPVEVKPAPEAPTAIVYRELDTIGAEVYLKSKSAQRAREMYYSHPAADSAEFEVKPTTSPALVETGERVIALPTVATSEVESARKRLSEATSAYWNHYRQMETKRGNGRYAKNTALLMRDTETLYNLSKQLGRAATAYAQMVSLSAGD